jgi:hypothetical protein
MVTSLEPLSRFRYMNRLQFGGQYEVLDFAARTYFLSTLSLPTKALGSSFN